MDKSKESERLKKIKEENAKFEREVPYNFCDRWCERCSHKKQIRCRLYQDEFEQKITCIAHGREPDDLEITEEVMRWQFEGGEEKLEEYMKEYAQEYEQEHEIDFDDLPEEIKEHIKFVENNPLDATAEQYRKRAYEFLKSTFYNKEEIKPKLVYDFETVSWYHTLLPAKLHRALCGFHEPATEDEFALYDAVAQFAICKKAINKSVKALRKLKSYYSDYKNLIVELLALLHNILSRIKVMEEGI